MAEKEEGLLETAVREHARLVYRIAYSVLRNSADAEDATQEMFLRVLRYGKKIARIRRPEGMAGKRLRGGWPLSGASEPQRRSHAGTEEADERWCRRPRRGTDSD